MTKPIGPILSARGLRRHYGTGAALVHAVNNVNLDVRPGETVAVMRNPRPDSIKHALLLVSVVLLVLA